MDLQGKLLGAWMLAYFVSRLTVRLPYPVRRSWRIGLAHLVSFAAIIALIAAVRGPGAAFSGDLLMACLAPQTFWWLFDLLRKHKPGAQPKRSR